MAANDEQIGNPVSMIRS